MKNKNNLIVMLTQNDRTVKNAYEVFDKAKHSKAEYWGFKEMGLPPDEMKALYAYMKSFGKTTVLEVVAYTEAECIRAAHMAEQCRCDILMGTLYFDSVNAFCQKHKIRYMPFVGKVKNRPSILTGDIDEIVDDAKSCIRKGASGIDLLGYRYTGNAFELIKKAVGKLEAPVCVAGSVDSYQRLDEIKSVSPWAFTIGNAFFENKFGEDFAEQINNVYDYINKD